MKNVLWIDDDERMLNSSIPLFERNGFFVFKATNTSRALTVLRTHKGQLDGVLLDVRLSQGENGLELLQELRERYPDLKVVVFTAYPNYDDHISAESLGALTYFQKIDKAIPLDPGKQQQFFSSLNKLFDSSNFPPETRKNVKCAKPKVALWASVLVILLFFFVVVGAIVAASYFVPGWIFPIAIAFSLLFFILLIICLLRLQGDESLSEAGFLDTIAQVLKRTVQLLKFWSSDGKHGK